MDSEVVARPATGVAYQLDLDEEVLTHLIDTEAWQVIQAEGFSPDLIEDPWIREVFVWSRTHLQTHRKPPSASVLAAEYDIDLRAPETAIGDLLDRLRERYMKNQGRAALRHIIETTFKEDPLAVPQELLRCGRDLSHLLSKRGEMYGTGDLDRLYHRYELKAAQGQGPSFGHPILDDYFYGMNGLTFWLAPPKNYKSWMMIQCALLNVLDGKSVWLLSLELPAYETDMRMHCMAANIPWYKYTRNLLNEQDWAEIRDVAAQLDAGGLYRFWKPGHGERDIDYMVNKARDAGADLVIIDQLQYVENGHGESLGSLNKTGEYFQVLDKARTLSDEGPLLIAHQFHRNPGGYETMPSVDHAKGSSSIEEVATLCLGMYANKDMKRSGRVEVGTLIARNANFASWAMDIDLSHGCTFSISHRIEDE